MNTKREFEMKKVCLVFAVSLFVMSCNNSSKVQTLSGNEVKTEVSSKPAKVNAKIDPVCGMPEGSIAYTDFSVYQSDTTWFCSPHCKKEFDKDPAKYVKK